MIQDNIDKLIPFLSENFLTYPLWEEGKYMPFINFWQPSDKFKNLSDKIKVINDNSGYIIFCEMPEARGPINLTIYPNFEELDNGGYTYTKKDWSIEEMISIVEILIKSK